MPTSSTANNSNTKCWALPTLQLACTAAAIKAHRRRQHPVRHMPSAPLSRACLQGMPSLQLLVVDTPTALWKLHDLEPLGLHARPLCPERQHDFTLCFYAEPSPHQACCGTVREIKWLEQEDIDRGSIDDGVRCGR